MQPTLFQVLLNNRRVCFRCLRDNAFLPLRQAWGWSAVFFSEAYLPRRTLRHNVMANGGVQQALEQDIGTSHTCLILHKRGDVPWVTLPP